MNNPILIDIDIAYKLIIEVIDEYHKLRPEYLSAKIIDKLLEESKNNINEYNLLVDKKIT